MTRTLAGLAALILIGAAMALWLAPQQQGDDPRYRRLSFAQLPGWAGDDHRAALAAFVTGCPALIRRDAPTWLTVCTIAETGPEPRRFFETYFTPVAVHGRGLITGYFLPLLHGSRSPGGPYQVPLYARPPELISVDLGDFRHELAGQRIAGKRFGTHLIPMPDRAEIEAGALADRGLELLWVDSAVEAFFLHIQGSGLVELPTGERLLIGYAGQNGHPYRSLGRLMIQRGLLTRGEVTAQAIAAWLKANPDAGAALMRENPSYVFFRELTGDRPLGGLGAPLTPERSLAVDERFVPLGVPVW